ncbi:TrkH family potassium uptake protein [Nannocystis pusilla]|uniref:TrkH family potassium uptake protein n=1 Tax=Nannocystis pusilla TaxID=889268 RepID=A0ABS7TY22_9BACT|nr:TrkH family potassium uptake protein [Nannocystis pusilla]MBZ5713153.1 TrkH family potassium uptake protein [Nannocystis pusilla]
MSAAPVPRPSRRLQAARVAGASLLSVLGVRIVADLHRDSFLGKVDELLSVGNLYAIAMGLVTLAVIAGLLGGRRWAFVFVPLLLSINAGMFVPLIASDVQIAGFLIVWNLALIGDTLFAISNPSARARRVGDRGESFAWLQRYGAAAQHLLLVSLLAGLALFGFEVEYELVPDLIGLTFALTTLALVSPYVYGLMRQRRRYLLAVVAAAVLFVPAATTSPGAVLALLWALQAAVLLVIVARGPVFADLLQSFYARPALLILSTFGLIAFSGALVLTFPAASASERSIAFIDALFTAMSATCVTGLIVLDTPVAFSHFGQVVIMLLIQLGGLGIMVLSTFAAVLLGGRLALRGEQALEEVLDLTSPGSAYALTRFIVVSTLLIEAIGALVLALVFHFGYGFDFAAALWRGSFHAISAFCNAGFALWSDSLIQFQSDGLVQAVHGTLITLGGLGFPVLLGLWLRARGGERRLSLQARVVLWMSLSLVVGGTVLFALAEWDASLHGLSVADKIINSLFQSVTLRTAGFNSVDLSALERSTILMMIVWMFIGASPGSTGGGIKTTTLAVVLAAVPALIRNQARAQLFRRTIPHDVVYRAGTIMTLATMVAVTITFALLASHDMSFERAAFETVSALATVGLSIGATAELNALGKWLIIVTMFVGRVGPISLALALGTPRGGHVQFPEAKIMVG